MECLGGEPKRLEGRFDDSIGDSWFALGNTV